MTTITPQLHDTSFDVPAGLNLAERLQRRYADKDAFALSLIHI